jgi:hypothetical protein
MELRDAIEQISRIHTQLAATERLRSLRAVPVALSGVFAIVAALLQPSLVGDPLARPDLYLLLWCSAALTSGIVAGAVVLRRVLRTPGALSVANARLAAMQFLPCLLVGMVITWFVAARLPQQLWLLPGLWQLLFGLGNLAAHRLLPLPGVFVGLAYVATGTACLWFERLALDPWAMGLPFAAGQLALAGILWWHHERTEQDERMPEVRA